MRFAGRLLRLRTPALVQPSIEGYSPAAPGYLVRGSAPENGVVERLVCLERGRSQDSHVSPPVSQPTRQ